jgi:hypothetical protein
MNRFRIRYELKAALWFIPLRSLVAFIALAVVTLAIDRAEDYKPIAQSVTGSATSLQQTSTAAGSLLSAAVKEQYESDSDTDAALVPDGSGSEAAATLSCARHFERPEADRQLSGSSSSSVSSTWSAPASSSAARS